MEYSFKEYVKDNFYNEIWEKSENFLYDYSDFDDLNLVSIGEKELEDIIIKSVNTEFDEHDRLKFDVTVLASVSVRDGDHHEDNTQIKEVCLSLDCEAGFEDSLKNINIKNVEEYSMHKKKTNPISNDLVPIIRNSQLEDKATDFLKEYYPEALKEYTSDYINPYKLADTLGLKVEFKHIEKDGSVLGRIYFDDLIQDIYNPKLKKYEKEKIEKNTILVDKSLTYVDNIGRIHNTIFHECVHKILHHGIFKFRKIVDNVNEPICTMSNNKSLSYIEIQARKLAPRLHMPKERFVKRTRILINELLLKYNTFYINEIMEEVISELSKEFKASKQSVKIRLVELAFHDAMGTLIYIDGKYVKPYTFKKGALKVNETYSISLKDAALQKNIDANLANVLKTNDYIFVDSHLIYNAPKYVVRNDNNELELTKYALSHMDECCLKFKLKTKEQKTVAKDMACFLNRSKDSDAEFEVKYNGKAITELSNVEICKRVKLNKDYINIREKLTDSRKECISELLKWRKKDITTLAADMGVDRKTITRWLKPDWDANLVKVQTMCFVLNLPPIISEKVREVFGVKFNPSNIEHQWLREADNLLYAHHIADIDKYLLLYNVKIFK